MMCIVIVNQQLGVFAVETYQYTGYDPLYLYVRMIHLKKVKWYFEMKQTTVTMDRNV